MKFTEIQTAQFEDKCLTSETENAFFSILTNRFEQIYVYAKHKDVKAYYNSAMDNLFFDTIQEAQKFCENFEFENHALSGEAAHLFFKD